MNVSCNIFINSFGSIAETTMVSPLQQLLFPQQVSLPWECFSSTLGIPQEGTESGISVSVQVNILDKGLTSKEGLAANKVST